MIDFLRTVGLFNTLQSDSVGRLLVCNVPILHTWKIYSKKDDIELSFLDRRYFFDRNITTTMYVHTIEIHDVRCSSLELYNLISCQPIGTRNSSLPVL